jgi:hypothetical protein
MDDDAKSSIFFFSCRSRQNSSKMCLGFVIFSAFVVGIASVETIPLNAAGSDSRPSFPNMFPLTITSSYRSQACTTFKFNTHTECVNYYQSASTNCTHSPSICSASGWLMVCVPKTGGTCWIHVPVQVAKNAAIGASACPLSEDEDAAGTLNAVSSGLSRNGEGTITFSYWSQLTCRYAARALAVTSNTTVGGCAFTELCKDTHGNPSKKITLAPITTGTKALPLLDQCGVGNFLQEEFDSLVIDFGDSLC